MSVVLSQLIGPNVDQAQVAEGCAVSSAKHALLGCRRLPVAAETRATMCVISVRAVEVAELFVMMRCFQTTQKGSISSLLNSVHAWLWRIAYAR